MRHTHIRPAIPTTSQRSPNDQKVRGMLIYPRVDRTVRETYNILGMQVDICTVDLGQKEWTTIHHEICELVQ